MNRQQLIDTLTGAVRDHEFIRAAWLGGSDATGRTDDLSDVDLITIAQDDRVEDTFAVVESAIETLSPISHRYRLPSPTPHGFEQTFYRFEQASPFLLLDMVVMAVSDEDRLLERERHGDPIVLLDRDGLIVVPPLDGAAHQKRIDVKLADLRARFPIFQNFVIKAIEREQPIDAMQFYRFMTLIPLAELLRIRHCPERFDFGLRYLDHDLPPELAATITRLSYAPDMSALRGHQAEAQGLFDEYADKS